jgi:hypothetical protein
MHPIHGRPGIRICDCLTFAWAIRRLRACARSRHSFTHETEQSRTGLHVKVQSALPHTRPRHRHRHRHRHAPKRRHPCVRHIASSPTVLCPLPPPPPPSSFALCFPSRPPVDDGARKVPNRVHETLRRRRHLLRRVPYPESTANPLSLGGSGNMDSVTVCLRGCLPPAWAAYSRPSTCPALTCPGLQTCSHPPEHGMGIA